MTPEEVPWTAEQLLEAIRALRDQANRYDRDNETIDAGKLRDYLDYYLLKGRGEPKS